MKWIKLPLLFLILLVSFTNPSNSLAENELKRALIMFDEAIDVELIEENNGLVVEELLSINSVSAYIPSNSINNLKQHPAIKYLEEDNIVSVQAQWTDWGTEKIEAPRAWTSNLTGKGVKVAIIDTGIAKHNDLNIKKGVSFVSYTNSFEDDHGHGTHVAGVISAGKNHQGLRGIAPDVDLYAIKVLDNEGQGYHSNVIKGIEWAMDQKVDIINLSIGGSDSSVFLEQIINKAYEDHNIVIVAAAGNNAHPLVKGNTVEYPAKYSSVIAVAATDRFDQRGNFSGHGSEVELAAPGVRIQSTYLNNSYAMLSGTSMAAPHVTGMLALLKQAQPSKTNKELREMIKGYTLDLGTRGKDPLFGYGRIVFPNQLNIEVLPPKNITYGIRNQTDERFIKIEWEHPSASVFHIYRNGEKIAEITDNYFFEEKLINSQDTYEVSAVIAEIESVKITVKIRVDFAQTADLYTDVFVTNWFISSLHQLQQEKIVGGYPDGTFRPNRAVTRGELAAMLGRSLKLDGTKRHTVFSDVNEQFFASGFIQTMQELGLITGYPDGTFRPNNPVTREEVAIFLTRAFKLTKQSNQTFPDVDPAHYTFSAIQRTVGEGIATGYPDGTFRPKQAVTRAEITTFLARSLNK